FGAILCHLRWREAPPARAWRWQIASLIGFGLALLAKETAIVVPAVLFGYEYLFPSEAADTRWKRIRHAFLAVAPYAAVILVYLGMRLYALKSLSPLSRPWTLSMLLQSW